MLDPSSGDVYILYWRDDGKIQETVDSHFSIQIARIQAQFFVQEKYYMVMCIVLHTAATKTFIKFTKIMLISVGQYYKLIDLFLQFAFLCFIHTFTATKS